MRPGLVAALYRSEVEVRGPVIRGVSSFALWVGPLKSPNRLPDSTWRLPDSTWHFLEDLPDSTWHFCQIQRGTFHREGKASNRLHERKLRLFKSSTPAPISL